MKSGASQLGWSAMRGGYYAIGRVFLSGGQEKTIDPNSIIPALHLL